MRVRTPEEERRGATAAALPAAAPVPHEAIIRLQQTAGNAAVSRALLQREDDEEPAAAPPDTTPDLRYVDRPQGPAVRLLQNKLNWHLGAAGQTTLLIDADFGGRTARAVMWFRRQQRLGGGMDVDQRVWDALAREPQPRVTRPGEQMPDYDRMVEDGLLEVTIAHGFDEGGAHGREVPVIIEGLTDVRGFTEDRNRADDLRRAAGRPAVEGWGRWFVKERYSESAGRPVHAVVQLIAPMIEALGVSGEVRDTVLAGMNESDAFGYSGHARYGTGPDFDQNYRFRVDWSKYPDPVPEGRSGTQEIRSVYEFTTATAISGSEAEKIARFEMLRERGCVTFIPMAEGNVPINPGPMAHASDFGGHLMRLAVEGQPMALSGAITEDRYRLWVFNGCETHNYTRSVRNSGERFNEQNLDMVTTPNLVPANESAEEMLAFLDGVMMRDSAQALQRRLQNVEDHDAYTPDGFADNARAPR